MREFDNFINGRFVPSSKAVRIVVKNPANGDVICSVPNSTQAEVDEALSAAANAQPAWAQEPAVARANLLKSIAAKIRENVEDLARVITEEQGKVLGLSRVEVAFTA